MRYLFCRGWFVLVGLFIVVACTQFPFAYEVPTEQSLARWVFLFLGGEDLRGIIENTILFLPFGLGVTLWLGGFLGRPGRILVAATVLSFILSYTVEFIQHFLPHRSPSRLDLLANTFGGLLAAAAHQLWWHLGRSRWVLLWIIVSVFLAISFFLQSRSQLSNWDPDFHFALQNEVSGDRSWLGEVNEVLVFDRALSGKGISELQAEMNVGLLGSYGLRADGVMEHSGTLPPLVRKQSKGRTWYRSERASDVIERIRETNRFTLIVRFTSHSLDQHGPSRVVTLSRDSMNCNLTIAQNGRNLVVRLRTPLTGPIGMNPALEVVDLVTIDQELSVAVTYDGAELRVFRSGKLVQPVVRLTPSAGLLRGYLNHFGNMPSFVYDLVFYGVFCFPMGVLLKLVLVRKVQLIGWVLIVLCASILLEWMLALWGQRVIQLDIVAFTTGFTLMGLLAASIPRPVSSG